MWSVLYLSYCIVLLSAGQERWSYCRLHDQWSSVSTLPSDFHSSRSADSSQVCLYLPAAALLLVSHSVILSSSVTASRHGGLHHVWRGVSEQQGSTETHEYEPWCLCVPLPLLRWDLWLFSDVVSAQKESALGRCGSAGMFSVWENLHHCSKPQGSHEHAQGHPSLQMSQMWRSFCLQPVQTQASKTLSKIVANP